MTPREELEKQMVEYKELVDFIADAEEYLYNWAQIYPGKYNYVDYSKWPEFCLNLMQEYKFDIGKIKEDIVNGEIKLPKYTTDNPKLVALERQLYAKHKEKVDEFERNYLGEY